MTTEELYNITRSVPTGYYYSGKYYEWNTEDPSEQDSFIDRGLVDDMDNLSGPFCEYMFSNSAPSALIEPLRHKLQIYVKWWNNCKDKLQTEDLYELEKFYVVCQNWLSIINEALPKLGPQQAGSDGGATLPEELNTGEAIALSRESNKNKHKGRPKKSLKEKMFCKNPEAILFKLHQLINDKKGRDVALIITACIKAGVMAKPTYGQVANEFGDIGNQQGYNRYMREKPFDDAEIEAIISKIKE